MALLVIMFICYIIYVKLLFYIHVCNSYLVSPAHCLLEVINMILVTSVPEKNLPVLEDVYSIFLSEVHSVWINWDLSALLKKIQEWKKLTTTLEAVETSLITSAMKSFHQHNSHELAQLSGVNTEKEKPLWKHYLKEKDCDHMYIPWQECTWMPVIPIIERRVDTIHHCLGELAQINTEIKADLVKLSIIC